MKARITCPFCKHVQEIDVPTNKCLPMYKCGGCGKLVQAPRESCCVICAYSDVECPAHPG